MKPRDCIQEEVLSENRYKSPSCNRIREHYKDTVDVRWKSEDMDPLMANGTAKWSFVTNYKMGERANVLY